VRATLHDDVLADLEAPTPSTDPEEERWRRARLLLAAIDGDRERLFELQSLFLLRLHRASDDLGASEGLRVVEAAIAILMAEAALAG
jgi:hypothetical protein